MSDSITPLAMASQESKIPMYSTTRQKTKQMLIATLLVVSPTVGFLVAKTSSFPSEVATESFLVLLSFGVCVIPFIVAMVSQRKFDPFEPIYMLSFLGLVLFVWAPATMIHTGNYSLLGIDYRAQFMPSMYLAITAHFSLAAGYYIRLSRWQRNTVGWLQNISPTSGFRWTLITSVSVIILIAVWIKTAGVSIRSLNALSIQQGYNSWWTEAETKIGYLYASRESLTAVMLLLLAFRHPKNKNSWLYVVLWGTIAVFYAQFGSRGRILMFVVATFIYLHLEKGTRPRIWQTIILACLVSYFIIGTIGYYRLSGHGIEEGFITLPQAWESFQESVFDVGNLRGLMGLVYIVPDKADYLYGTTLLHIVTQAVPRVLWPGKPASPVGRLVARYAPGGGGTALPYFAEFYLNFGVSGVILSMIILGSLCRSVYQLWAQYPDSPATRVTLALSLPLLIHIYTRAPLSASLPYLFFTLSPIAFVCLMSRNSDDKKRMRRLG